MSLVVLVAVLAAGTYFYVDSKLGGIRRIAVPALTSEQAGKPIDILLIGSDSRSFVNNPTQAREFGSTTSYGGQRSDVSIIMRLVPATSRIEMLAIPRDLWVHIAGTTGSNKINAAFGNGPNQLVQTIQQDFKIPINHVMVVNFPGFAGMVNSLGGISLDFSMPVRDTMSGLNVTQTGCQMIDGTQALALVRSRHLYYYEKGAWHYDGMSDWSRIRRQQAFFHALLDRVHTVIPDVFRLNSFLDAAVSDLTVDSNLSSSEMISLGIKYRSVSAADLSTTVLPTTPTVINGTDALLPAQPYTDRTIAQFLAFGASSSASGATSSTTGTKKGRSKKGSSTGSPPSSSTGSQQPPSNVVTDTPQSLPEPWNPTPC